VLLPAWILDSDDCVVQEGRSGNREPLTGRD
jgi:hypothetical protein